VGYNVGRKIPFSSNKTEIRFTIIEILEEGCLGEGREVMAKLSPFLYLIVLGISSLNRAERDVAIGEPPSFLEINNNHIATSLIAIVLIDLRLSSADINVNLGSTVRSHEGK
jgi:hypothetical protein